LTCPDATEVTGRFGFLEGAYTNGGRSNGAEFLILWSNGKDTVELFRRFLEPPEKSPRTGACRNCMWI